MKIADITQIFALPDRELWLVTSAADSRRGGFIATFVSQASIVPEMPRVIVGVSRQHYTWELIEASNSFAAHLLGEDNLSWVWRFGLHSGRDIDKLSGVASRLGETGSPILADAACWLDCRVESRLDTGDRTVYLARVVAGELRRAFVPLTVKRLSQIAPAEQLQRLDERMARDIAVDADAIQAWRQQLAERGRSL